MKERKTRKRETNMATEKFNMTGLFDKFLTTYKQTHVSVNGQQAQTECSRLWREIKKGKENAATKSEAQKLMLQWKMNVKKPGKGSIVIFFLPKPLQRKVSYLLICYNHTNIYPPKLCKLFKHCMKGTMS